MIADIHQAEEPWLDQVEQVLQVPDPPQTGDVLRAIQVLLACSDSRTLGLTGPPGIGKTAVLTRVGEYLAVADGVALFAANAGSEPSHTLFERLHSVIHAADGEADPERLVILIDDVELLDDTHRRGLLELPHRHSWVHVVVSANSSAPLDGVPTLPIRPLRGPEQGAGLAILSEVARFFLLCLRRRDPTFSLTFEDLGRVTRICAVSFGIPADVDTLAELVARYGLTAVHDAVTEDVSRNRLGEFIEGAEPRSRNLTNDEMVVLASILAMPGGASLGILRQSLPRCDIDRLTGSLIERGLVFNAASEASPSRDRYHLRVAGFSAANWCAGQPEISLAAIRQSQADYLSSHIRRLAANCFSESQGKVLDEFQHEQRNLRCAITELVGNGRYAQAVALMSDALPLLARTCGVAELLPHLLPIIREYDPTTAMERHALARLAVRVFAMAGEQEAAAVCLESLCPTGWTDPETILLHSLVVDDTDAESLAECVKAERQQGDLRRLTETVAEYVACLIRTRQFERADDECRLALYEAMRNGDGYAAGSLLLWRAAAACGKGHGDARLYIERALEKFLPLGPAVTMSAVETVIGGRHSRNLKQGGRDLAMVVGSLARVYLDCNTVSWPTLAETYWQLSKRIGARSLWRGAVEGMAADLVDLLHEILQRRFNNNGIGRSVLPGQPLSETPNSRLLKERSKLTTRESEVASLVADGLTNKQIARQLCISDWTVINHLRQVMRKLNCTSRVQVARWVHGLAYATPSAYSSG
ncbi:LuxR C-terminal-related transcriptional regulator [Rhizohabitans arisaemae]|uniref:LuxR C-terminal-related transcriptional regulator n=1 Tax=Rhizohabitans arisaemae TaxID=2720610 RepID=UPI0024B20A07|nr:LuxR C-terminal-related transcriptional regulator [Rhizohabitans arisaemae]